MIRDRIILVGQAPSRNGDPKTPLMGGRSGFFLQQLCGMTLLQYARAFETVNLIYAWPGRARNGVGDLFHSDEARQSADEKVTAWRGRRVILLGKNVARAFGHSKTPMMQWVQDRRGFVAAVVPHPSGVNRWWNDAGNREKAQAFLRNLKGAEDGRKAEDIRGSGDRGDGRGQSGSP